MSAISHILVLSQPEFLERQVCGAFAEQAARPSRRIAGWFKRRSHSLA